MTAFVTTALIGGTGLVGGTLLRSRRFDAVYRSTDIGEIAGRRFDHVICAGAPAEKWRANQDPAADWQNLERLVEPLSKSRIGKLVLISTVDVYGTPLGVTECDAPSGATPYGRHRLELERILASRFSTLVVRLPALFGPGLKKNAVYDLLHGNQVERIDDRGSFQFYDLSRLSSDLEVAEAAGLSLVHFATQPVTIRQVAREAFGVDFSNRLEAAPTSYDVRSVHAPTFGGSAGYVADAAAVLAGMRSFVAAERKRRKCG
jgi:nucleoside-diphosphate-sugar epimerase